MKVRALVKMGGVLMVALGALVPMEAKAFPFETTPESFIEYLNRQSWEDTSRYVFFNPRNCATSRNYKQYMCELDFRQTTSLGTRTCIGDVVIYSPYSISPIGGGNGEECSAWEKVVETPDPQPAPTTQDPSQPIPPIPTTTTSTTLNNNLILAGGAGIFVAGGLLGVAFSQLLGRRNRE